MYLFDLTIFWEKFMISNEDLKDGERLLIYYLRGVWFSPKPAARAARTELPMCRVRVFVRIAARTYIYQSKWVTPNDIIVGMGIRKN